MCIDAKRSALIMCQIKTDIYLKYLFFCKNVVIIKIECIHYKKSTKACFYWLTMRCLAQHNVLYSENFKNKIKLITLMAGLGCFLYSVCAFQLCIFKFRLPIYAYK